MLNVFLIVVSLFFWLVYTLKKLTSMHSRLNQDGELKTSYLKKSLIDIWLTGLLAGLTFALSMGEYHLTSILVKRILGFGIVFPSVAVIFTLIGILQFEKQHK